MDVFWLAKKALPNPMAKPPKGGQGQGRRRQNGGGRGAAAAPAQRGHAHKALGTGLGVLFLACLLATGHAMGQGTADSGLFMALGLLGAATWLVRR